MCIRDSDQIVAMCMLIYTMGVLIPYWIEMLRLSCQTAVAYAMVHAFCLFMLCFGHQLAAGNANVAYILSLRLIVTLTMASANFIALSLGSASACVHVPE